MKKIVFILTLFFTFNAFAIDWSSIPILRGHCAKSTYKYVKNNDINKLSKLAENCDLTRLRDYTHAVYRQIGSGDVSLEVVDLLLKNGLTFPNKDYHINNTFDYLFLNERFDVLDLMKKYGIEVRIQVHPTFIVKKVISLVREERTDAFEKLIYDYNFSFDFLRSVVFLKFVEESLLANKLEHIRFLSHFAYDFNSLSDEVLNYLIGNANIDALEVLEMADYNFNDLLVYPSSIARASKQSENDDHTLNFLQKYDFKIAEQEAIAKMNASTNLNTFEAHYNYETPSLEIGIRDLRTDVVWYFPKQGLSSRTYDVDLKSAEALCVERGLRLPTSKELESSLSYGFNEFYKYRIYSYNRIWTSEHKELPSGDLIHNRSREAICVSGLVD